MKKILLSTGAITAVLVGASMFAAFEAHVVNVTARIENALSVQTDWIDFGTVFPQEHLDQTMDIALSGSFISEDRVDDVQYFIRQKPKCAITSDNGTVLVDEPLATTGHIIVENEEVRVDCGEAPRTLENGENWGVLPSLCPYISKSGNDPDGTSEENDETTTSFHQPWTIDGNDVSYLDTRGYLAKSIQDTLDTWTIDLAVPCFGGYCAQDWLTFVRDITGNDTLTLDEANKFVQPFENEHKVFGCDLWVEVSGVSEAQ